MNGVSRRTLLGGLAVGAGALAGCIGTIADDGDESGPEGTEDLPAKLRLKEVSTPGCEEADLIVYADLSTDEQDLVETALREGEYAVPTEKTPPAFESFRERVEARTDNCGEVEVYLRRDGTYYRVALVNGDHIIAHSDGEEY